MTSATERTLLFTDIEGSTQLVERLGDERAAALWVEHDRRARALLAAHRGREIDRSDGFFLLFDAAIDAAEFALAYHAALAGLALKARVGLHVGPVRLRENPAADVARGAKPVEVEGLAKPFAARLMALAQGGQTLLSPSARAALPIVSARAALQDGAALPGARIESHGHYRLKGLAEPVEVFELGASEGGTFVPPADTEKAYRVVAIEGLWRPLRVVRHNLPPERDAFIGRASDLTAMARRLDDGVRLLTLQGPAGVGKTRLARRYGLAWLGDWPGGVYFCDLSEARSLDGLHFAVAVAMAVPLGKDDPGVQLGHAIAGRGRCLLILDNFEQLVAHAALTLGRWLDRASEASFVATSRERLQLQGEEVITIEPLPLHTDAVALFEVRARAQRADFALDAPGRDAVADVVRLLDGLPLAIELAAARVRVLSPAQIAARMNDRFKLLAGAKGAAARQATLKAAIDWSWELLAPWEQAALAQCSVFEAGFTLEAAEATLDLSAWPEAPAVMDAVQALVDKSLLRTWLISEPTRMAQDEPYFGMYLSIHDYAADKLEESSPEATRQAQARHGHYFARFGSDEAVESLSSPGGVRRRRALALEIDNLIAACRRAIVRGDGETAVTTLVAAWQVLDLQGPLAAAAEMAEQALGVDGLSDSLRCSVLIVRAHSLSRAGRYGEARAGFDQALALADPQRDRHRILAIQRQLTVVCNQQGLSDEAWSHCQSALALSRAGGDRRTLGTLSSDLGNLCSDRGLLHEALQHYEQSIAIRREFGDRRGEGVTLGNLAALQSDMGRLAEAIATFEAAMAVHREVGDIGGLAGVVANLGVLRHNLGQEDAAAQCLEEALAIHRAMGERRLEGVALSSLGAVRFWQGRLDEAHRTELEALAILRQLGIPLFEANVLDQLGAVYTRLRRFDEARRCLDEALAIVRGLGTRRFEAMLVGSLASLLIEQGRLDEAAALLRDSEATLREVDDRLELAKLLCVRGRAEHLAGQGIAARRALDEADSLARAIGAPPASELVQAVAALHAALA